MPSIPDTSKCQLLIIRQGWEPMVIKEENREQEQADSKEHSWKKDQTLHTFP